MEKFEKSRSEFMRLATNNEEEEEKLMRGRKSSLSIPVST
jgi:hypothetical protein